MGCQANAVHSSQSALVYVLTGIGNPAREKRGVHGCVTAGCGATSWMHVCLEPMWPEPCSHRVAGELGHPLLAAQLPQRKAGGAKQCVLAICNACRARHWGQPHSAGRFTEERTPPWRRHLLRTAVTAMTTDLERAAGT